MPKHKSHQKAKKRSQGPWNDFEMFNFFPWNRSFGHAECSFDSRAVFFFLQNFEQFLLDDRTN